MAHSAEVDKTISDTDRIFAEPPQPTCKINNICFDDLNHLVFGEKRQMKQDLDWFSIGSHNNKLGNASVESLGGYTFQSAHNQDT